MRRTEETGLTLIEMMTVFAIIGILCTIAASVGTVFIGKVSLRSATEAVAADIRRARWVARTTSSYCTMSFDVNQRSYMINGSDTGKLPQGLRFGVDPTVTGKPTQAYEEPPVDGISFDGSGSRNKNKTRFYPTGAVVPTGAVYITDGKSTMAITVAITGRPKLWRSCGGKKWVPL